ncbi:hypothetical protein FRACYDRAFT_235397 [Fragilariopsis cylindrus CCMP1102]|uniref:Uncharacterized protein n=1 Tax=Fragilariopsis cylindrus CCMP1102 TaxID=635003 RepID=A0A1E7FMG2_9STRA|nr:hypothetical protein FRACYDRAFT_235397 [Fragilariopsis cylindrus CCMP1102]|eukprot:OEU19350.1 hypothetical protein FRACYDRAFT_235397 [Fragilariopsis cylindrus CCMP1102]
MTHRLRLEQIHYSQETCSDRFGDGSILHVDNIEDDWIMDVVSHYSLEHGKYYTLNNRTLKAYDDAYSSDTTIWVRLVSTPDDFNDRLTTGNLGCSIRMIQCAIKLLHATAITENVALAAQVAMFMPTHKHTTIALAIVAALMVVISRQPHLNAQRAIKFLHATAITENVALAAQVAMFMPTHKHTTRALAIAAHLNAKRAIKFLHATAITENVALAAQVVMFMLTHKHTTIALAIAAALAALMVGKNNSTISPRRQTKIILQIQKVAVQSYIFALEQL